MKVDTRACTKRLNLIENIFYFFFGRNNKNEILGNRKKIVLYYFAPKILWLMKKFFLWVDKIFMNISWKCVLNNSNNSNEI